MKKLSIFLLSLTAIFASCTSQEQSQGYVVKAKIDNPHHYSPYYLAYRSGDKYVIDTGSTLENGWVIFKGKVNEPTVASFGVRGNPASFILLQQGGLIPGPSLNFFLSNETIKIEGSADATYAASVSGGKANKEWAAIKSKEDALTGESWTTLKKAYDNFKPGDDSVVFTNARKLRSDNEAKDEKLRTTFIKEHPNSLVSMYFLVGQVNTLSLDELKAVYAGLGDEHKNSWYAKFIAGKIKSMDATAVGATAVPINKKDMNGNPVNLQSLSGKYVLLVFWGSWCGPCRAEDPHLKELYAQYKKDGFEIVGIAQEESQDLETNKKAWKKAVEEDGLPWIQVLNNEGIKQFDAVKAYGVTAFPTKILLDKEGKIVARYVGGENDDLDKKLQEIYGG